MKLKHWFADQLVIRSQTLADLYVRYDEHGEQETESRDEELLWETTEAALLRAVCEAHSRFELAVTAFRDILVAAIARSEASTVVSDDEPPWDF